MASLQLYDPFADPAVESLFRNFFRQDRNERAAPQSVSIDVAESDNGYVVHAELPGTRKDEIHVAVEGNQVTIAAEVKRTMKPGEGTRVLRSERYYGSLSRAFTLGQDIDDANVKANYADGVLTLSLPKKTAAASKKITIQ